MNYKEIFEQWKSVGAFTLLVVGATFGIITWAAESQEEAIIVMKAQSALIHNNYYQEGRIARKQDQITENKRELNNLLDYIKDDQPTIRQQRDIDYLDEEIIRLRKEIEEIRVNLAVPDE